MSQHEERSEEQDSAEPAASRLARCLWEDAEGGRRPGAGQEEHALLILLFVSAVLNMGKHLQSNDI